jgi:hypothetical protein
LDARQLFGSLAANFSRTPRGFRLGARTGEELAMEGALPLGMIEGAEPSVMRFELKAGDWLALMSDGIALCLNHGPTVHWEKNDKGSPRVIDQMLQHAWPRHFQTRYPGPV